jgi:ATP synthase protein I
MSLNLPESAAFPGRLNRWRKDMAADETPQDPELPQDARLGSLEERLKRAQDEEAKRTGKALTDPRTRVWQLMFSHLIGAPAGGGILGWGLDSLFGTFPLFFLLMLFLGFGVGVVNVMRISKTPPGAS